MRADEMLAVCCRGRDARPAKPMTSLIAALALVAAVAGQGRASPAEQRSFSAEIVRHDTAGASAPAGRLDLLGDKIRLQTPELPDGYFVVDVAVPVAYFVRPAAHVYMDARDSSPLTRLFVPVDPGDPCRAWQAAAQLGRLKDVTGWQCAGGGDAAVGERHAQLYRVRAADQEQFTAWIDPDLGFPLQIKLPDGVTFTATIVRQPENAADRFEIPATFRKFDPAALVDRIRQSDVWVEPH